MNRLPGLNIPAADPHPDMAQEFLDTLFLSGGLYLSQIVRVTGLAPYEIQNWVRRRFLLPPVHKTYGRNQFCRIVLINHLRESLKIDTIAKLLEHINGHLDDASDDLIDDSVLYNYYVNTLLRLDGGLPDEKTLRKVVGEVAASYDEKVPGSRKRLTEVLSVMVYAGIASSLQEQCRETVISWADPNLDA